VPDSPQTELRQMIADHMEKGFLENIIDMFRHDRALYSLTGELIQDERVKVRLGVTALIEELKTLDPANLPLALENLLPLLEYANDLVRGDAANLIGIIGDKKGLYLLKKLLDDKNKAVRLIAKEALDDIERPA
jgi:HEAT repeat protein